MPTILSARATRRRGRGPWCGSVRRARFRPERFSTDGEIVLNGTSVMKTAEVPLRGVHNLENTMAAAAMASLAGATHAQIRAAVMTFPGVEHRLEFVRRLNGVDWYNDSKATNVDATLKAIAAFDGGLWVILGGKDKNSDYSVLAAPLQREGARRAADRRGGG